MDNTLSPTDDSVLPETKKWSVKNVALRHVAAEHARKRGEEIGPWLDRAIERQIKIEAADRIEFPPSRALVVEDRATPVVAPPTPMPLLDVIGAVQAMSVVAQAYNAKLPKSLMTHLFRILDAQLREIRGLPAAAPKRTEAKNGPTQQIEAET
jgi:hypothetical protein